MDSSDDSDSFDDLDAAFESLFLKVELSNSFDCLDVDLKSHVSLERREFFLELSKSCSDSSIGFSKD